MKLRQDFNKTFFILLSLALASLSLLVNGCQKSQKEPTLNYRAQVIKATQSFLNYQGPIKILGRTKTPSGIIYEVKADNGNYLNVRAKDLLVTFANLGEIEKRQAKPVFSYQQAQQIALSWTKKRSVFKKFKLVKSQVNFDWPKPTYFTVIWRAKNPKSKDKFAKVTVDLVTGKVVSYGVGDPKWSMFCLPLKNNRGLSAKKLLKPGI